MKKYVLFSMLAVAGFLSCGKDDKTEIDPTDTTTLSSKVKVYYSETVKGTIPAATDQTLILEPADGDVVAIDGRYTIIEPSFSVGAYSAAGYLVQLEGATSYFKVDYTLARNARKAANGEYKEQGEYFPGDSAIIMKLPDGVKSGKFTINVAAFSAGGSIGNTVKYTIEVKQPGGLAALNGTWKLSGTKKLVEGSAWDNDVYTPDTLLQTVYCINDKPTTKCPDLQFCTGTATPTYITELVKQEYVLGSNGSLTFTYSYAGRMPNWAASTCSTMAYTTYDDTYIKKGGWSYDDALKSIYVVYDSDGVAGTEYVDIAVIPVEIKAGKIILTKEKYEEYSKK